MNIIRRLIFLNESHVSEHILSNVWLSSLGGGGYLRQFGYLILENAYLMSSQISWSSLINIYGSSL